MAVEPTEEETYRFAEGGAAEGFASNYATDETIAMLAVCIAHQQSAGFKRYLDLRALECPNCRALGFNTGWGAWRFTCGAEVLSDGTSAEPCPKQATGEE